MPEDFEQQSKLLAQALIECIDAAGIVRPNAELTVPSLLLFAEDLKKHIEENENASDWRNLSLQFDRHRMSALAYLKAVVAGQEGAVEMARTFLSAPPIPGHELLSELEQLRVEVKTLREQLAQQPPDLKEPVEFEPEECESCGCDAEHLTPKVHHECNKCGYGQ